MSPVPSRFEINRKSRQVLVRHWIDLGHLTITATPSSVRLRGSLRRLPGSGDKLTSRAVETIFEELNRIKDVRHIEADFDNWHKAGTASLWKPLEEKARAPIAQSQYDGAPAIIDVEAKKRGN